MARSFALAVGVLVAIAAPVRADGPPAKALTLAPARGAIRVDGVLDDATWQAATWTDDFVDQQPTFGAPPAHPLRIALAQDGHALYVAARMESGGDRIAAPRTRRDDTSQAERIIVSLDPFRTRRFAYSFAVTAAGTRADWIHTDDDAYRRDGSWNPVWSAAVTRDATGWSAELRIPLGQLRYPAGADTWGINVNRYVPPTQEDVFWIAVPRDRTAWASWFGELRGAAALPAARRLELMPYAAVALALDEVPTGQLGRRADPDAQLGLDARLGLGSGLTLDATINPDFGQVEADPAVVNLSAYEVRFPERRPFFVEGQTIFTTAVRNYFYSRRIGGLPRVSPDVDELAPPRAARILGALKLTGRIGEATNVGAIAAVTDRALAAYVDGATRGTLELAPRTAWGVARVERELGGPGASVGAQATLVARDRARGPVDAVLVDQAVTGGVDLRLRPRGGAYELFADVGGSVLHGRPAAITTIATASAHYFQRPDAHVHLDPDARTMAGWCADLGGGRRSGAWQWSALATAESPGFEANEAGALQSADDLDATAELHRIETEAGPRVHAWRAGGGVSEGWNFGGQRKPASAWFDGGVTLPSFATASATATAWLPGLTDDLTRGGPVMAEGAGGGLSATWSSTPNRPLTWNLTGAAQWHQTRARGGSAQATIMFLPSPAVRVSLTPRALWQRTAQQYVTTDTSGPDPRYVFGALDQREVAAQLRVGVALTPDLAIDAYVEPFASVGRYTGFGQLATPGTHDVRRYGAVARTGGTVQVTDGTTFTFREPDFTAVSLRSTVVLRWELAPGSVLWAVWQSQRGDDQDVARWRGATLARPFTVTGEHVLAIKLAWWFAP